ncbi:hypothetical protein MMC13_004094 [Lambiella insularis]|nr:hypothetical protein [Lambiella insularis]
MNSVPETVQVGASERPSQDSIITIETNGDLLLQIQNRLGGITFYYQVSSEQLRANSFYFNRLLDPEKFSEGAIFCTKLRELMKSHSDISQIPAADLPVVRISDFGPFPDRYSNKDVMVHFFDVLHGTNSPWVLTRSIPTHIALLALVADRFDATAPVLEHVTSQGWVQPMKDDKELKKVGIGPSTQNREVLWRRRIYAGVLLGVQEWVTNFSRLLIDAGSKQWQSVEGEDCSIPDTAPWWNLPRGLEEELAYRRDCILGTISSLQSFYLTQYLSGQRQCRLGYDSSPQCDSFQLGEMTRFFTRKGTLALQSRIVERDYSPSCSSSIEQLLISLRECPAYQIDLNHKHCGLRSKLIPALETIQGLYQRADEIGVCLSCWNKDKPSASWYENPAGGSWHHLQARAPLKRSAPCGASHTAAMAMCTAESRDWSLER